MLGKVLRHHCLVKLAAEFGYVVFKCGILCLQLSDLLFENLREEALVPVLGFRIVALPCSLIRRSISPRCVRSMRLDLLILLVTRRSLAIRQRGRETLPTFQARRRLDLQGPKVDAEVHSGNLSSSRE